MRESNRLACGLNGFLKAMSLSVRRGHGVEDIEVLVAGELIGALRELDRFVSIAGGGQGGRGEFPCEIIESLGIIGL